MPEAFDPYFKWLGIPKADQPPHCYRLLGIELFESDLDVISNAADGRMAQVKNYQGGQYGAISQKLLNEIAAAKVWLLNPQKKELYDTKLRAALERRKQTASGSVAQGSMAVAQPLPETEAAVVEAGNESHSPFAGIDFQPTRSATATSMSPRSSASRSSSKKQKMPGWVVPSAAGAVALIVGLGIYAASPPGNNQPTAAERSSSDQVSEIKPMKTASDASIAPKSTHDSAAKSNDSHLLASTAPSKPVERMVALAKPASSPESATPKGSSDNVPTKRKTPAKVKPATAKLAANDFKPEEAAAAETNPAATESSDSEKHDKRLPLPDKSTLRELEAKIHSLFKDEFAAAAKAIEGHSALAKKLVHQAEESKDDANARFVLWKLGCDEAIMAGDCSLAMDTVDKMEQQFEFDGRKAKATLLDGAVQKSSITTTAPLIFDTAQKLAAASAEADDYDLALRFAKSANAAALKMRDKDPKAAHDASARRTEIEQMAAKYTGVQKAIETLASDPTDTDANLTAGKWYCFTKGNWEKGLPLLAKSGHKEFAELAKQELGKPSSSNKCVALADGWWALGEKDHGSLKSIFQHHAAQWYAEALPGISGLDKVQVEKRIASLKQETAAESHAGAAPSRGFGPRGVVVKGNVALLTNGATSTGPEFYPNKMLNPESKEPTSFAKAPCEFLITLPQIYQLQEIRFKLQPGQDATYQVWVSRDGKKYDMIADHSNQMAREWQEIRFPARPVQLVKLVCNKAAAPSFCVDYFEAYCLPDVPEKATGRQGRGR